MIISRTPLRVSFFGGGSDIPDWYLKHGGAVLSTTIDKYIYVIAKRRFDDKIVLHYTKTEVCNSVDEIQHDYIREALRMIGIEKGIEITTLADIPSEGTGLGSSSSLAVGLFNALYNYRNSHDFPLFPDELANWACKLEIEILKKGIGKQDQYAAAFGGFNKLVFYKDENVSVYTIDSNGIGDNFMLFYTGITRSASEILKDQVSRTEDNTGILSAMVCSVDNAIDLLYQGRYTEYGRYLHTAWQRKRSLSSWISNPEIEDMYSKARTSGAIGGKVCGAGGGGFMVLYVEPDYQDNVREALEGYQELPFKFEPEGSKIIFEG